MQYISLFSGVGGFDLGFDAAGWECVAQVEWDKDCQQVLARHWPNVPRWGDVSTVSGAELPAADVISFGSPCQDLSVAGKRAGLDGERSGLFHQAIRIIKEMRDATNVAFPRIAIWENVVGAMSSNSGADFGVVIDSLADAGALVIEWAVLDARWFGVPQRRRRVFVVAVFDPAIAERCGEQILPVGPRSGWNPPTRPASRPRSASTIEGSVGTARAYSTGFAKYTEGVGTLTSTDHKRPEMHVVATHTHTNALTCGLASGGPDLAHAEAGWLVGIGTGTGHRSTATELSAGRAADNGHRRSDMGDPEMNHMNQIPFIEVIRPASDQHPEVWRHEETAPTLNVFDNSGETRATVSMAAGFKAGQSDGGIGYEEETAPTLNAGMSALEPTVLAFSHTQGLDPQVSTEATPTLRNEGGGEAVLDFDSTWSNQSTVSVDLSPTIKVGSTIGIPSPPAVSTTAHVRRLTPLECERLMGWSDNHTLQRADGSIQPDSTRYRQCGNGVVANVAEWIAEQINRIVAE